jgi:flagellin
VIDSINAGTTIHGVTAGDSGTGGLSLTTVDGRNLSVWYDGSSDNGLNGSDFGLGLNTAIASNPPGITGVANANAAAAGTQEASTVSFNSLASGAAITVNGLTFTAASGITVTKEQAAAAFANITSGMTATDAATSHSASAALGTYTGKFNEGFTTGAVTDTFKVVATATTENKGNITDITIVGVNPVIGVVKTDGTSSARETNAVTFTALTSGQAITIAGLTFTAGSAGATAAQVATAFGSLATVGTTAADATTASGLASTIGTFTTGTLTGWTTGAASSTNVTFSSSTATGNQTDLAVTSTTLPVASTVPGLNVAASTVYGKVTLTSINQFTVRPGSNSYPSGGASAVDASYANFTALGFKSETYNPKNVGRLSFQVGPSPDQLIHIDLADFGKDGDITGSITSNKAPTNILTVQAANDVTQSVNKSLDMIASTRASMGAVMNRLQHVIDNLTNVVMNSEASRSQIEDADYAQASTELARTQIMQQAATAVLAQANTSQQSVLKLLQG